jgi:hypothetical protein
LTLPQLPDAEKLHSSRWQGTRHFACVECAHAFSWKPRLIIHSSSDWDRQLPLLLQTSCCGRVLWAFNEAHLQFIERYVSSVLRERAGSSNGSLASRLPQWIKSAKNRRTVLRGVRRLRNRLESF